MTDRERHHRRATRFFWCLVIAAAATSLAANIVHALWQPQGTHKPLVPVLAVQVGIAAVPPLLLLACIHGIGLSVRAGASGAVYRWSVTATAAIGVGAFILSFRSQTDLLKVGISPGWAWLWPAIIDISMAVYTLMLIALGDKPSAPMDTDLALDVGLSIGADLALDTDFVPELISSDTVSSVLTSRRNGATVTSAAETAGVSYQTADSIIQALEQGPDNQESRSKRIANIRRRRRTKITFGHLDFPGIYAYTYPSHLPKPCGDCKTVTCSGEKFEGRILMKIGKTDVSVCDRICEQTRHEGVAQDAIVLRVYTSHEPLLTIERKIHDELEALGNSRERGAMNGTEWFLTDLKDLDTTAYNLGLETAFSNDEIEWDLELLDNSDRDSESTVNENSSSDTLPISDEDIALLLIKSGVTTQPVETVVEVLAERRNGATINGAASAAGVNHRTAQRIIDGADQLRRTR